MKTKVMGALLLALIICASALVFASCARPGGEPAPSGGPDATVSGEPEPSGEPDATVTAEPDEDPEVYMDDSVREALEDYYALKQGDFSVLKKYWNGTLSEKITSEGAKLESAVYGLKTYCYAAPPIMTAERWDNMMAEAEEKYKDDPEFEFVREKLGGFYVLYDPPRASQERKHAINIAGERISLDLTECGGVYVCDPGLSPARKKELGRCFADYFGYTIEDVRDAAREVGIPDADLIGTVEPYFVFEYSDYGERVGAVEYSEEAVKKLESMCREYVDGDGKPLCYGKYEYKVTAVQEASYDEAFGEIHSEYKELTGEDLHRICKITLEEKKIGETVAATGEYREFSPEEAADVGFEEIFLCISDALEWEPEKIDFPWGGSARRALLLYAEVFDN